WSEFQSKIIDELLRRPQSQIPVPCQESVNHRLSNPRFNGNCVDGLFALLNRLFELFGHRRSLGHSETHRQRWLACSATIAAEPKPGGRRAVSGGSRQYALYSRVNPRSPFLRRSAPAVQLGSNGPEAFTGPPKFVNQSDGLLLQGIQYK